ncbi:MAG: transposase [Candidatus Marsarchaeota archaeon]|nr:transposase [Candidatus Marsarchaeota archaeon]MCL5413077.1 transposase [Candidatus Marsarchaeota archaeon]
MSYPLSEGKYACVDEKFISVHGKKKPQLFAICPETGLPLEEKLLRNREKPAITSAAKILKRMGIIVCITDDLKSYAPSIKAAGLRHQKCHFHAMRAGFGAMKKAHIQKKRKEKFIGWIKNFLRSKNLIDARSWLRVIGRMKREKKLGRFLKSFLFDWKDYFTYFEFPGCPKTSNAVEQFNRRFEQKYQSMHGFRKERTARSFTSLFILHSMFRKFESGQNKDRSPLEIAKIQLAASSVFDLLPH